MNCHFEIIVPSFQDWQRIESSPDCTCFLSHEWYAYLEHLGRHLVVVKIIDGAIEGYFIGARRRLGITIIESPPVYSRPLHAFRDYTGPKN